jgi:quercetin dioxygenase-like cupin family protein
MEREQFINMLNREGFREIVTVEREANGSLDVHTHPFEAKALILDGELRLYGNGNEHVCKVGDIFHLQANEAHAERYGPQGVRYLVGRK